MARTCFIVRPFDTKQGINFNRVQAELIDPALARLGISGDTTEVIASAGNIRADMFELLAKSDFVIADISIHNANVFYELGARHALRDKRTFLIRAKADEVPFDLRTDRYLSYDQEHPGKSLDLLVEGLRQTLDSDVCDSPIFKLVPNLEPQDWLRLIAVPEDFRAEVYKASQDKKPGDLELLSREVQSFDWASEGLRLIGQEQFKQKLWEGARLTWEAVVERLGGDLEASLKLGTIYQRLEDLAGSNVAIERVVNDSDANNDQRAEASSLLGSNAKQRWMEEWQDFPDSVKPGRALGSRYLEEAQNYYSSGFLIDLNHYYSGINALALQTIRVGIARLNPDSWSIDFDSDADAERALEKLEEDRQLLEGAVTLSVNRSVADLKRSGKADRWVDLTKADLVMLVAKNPARVARAYQRALGGAESFYFESARRQLRMYAELGVLADNVDAALTEISGLAKQEGIDVAGIADEAPDTQVLVFTGHRIDKANRSVARFPAEKEAVARAAIEEVVENEAARTKSGKLLAIAGGASGGDILFHEACARHGVESHLLLAIPVEKYIVESVTVDGAPEWIDRFHAIEQRCASRTLSQSSELPRWLSGKKDYTIWQRNNLWTLCNALAFGGKNVTLVALWNGQQGDGPGGTDDMVHQAKKRGAKTIHLDTKLLFSR